MKRDMRIELMLEMVSNVSAGVNGRGLISVWLSGTYVIENFAPRDVARWEHGTSVRVHGFKRDDGRTYRHEEVKLCYV